jgi:FtsH-binding integral membrane protein
MKDKTRIALDEARILVLVAQVLLGFQYQAVFQKNFERLPEASQNIKLLALILLLVALGLLMSPAPYNLIVDKDAEDPAFLRFVTAIMGIALVPFALGLGGDVYVAVDYVAGFVPGIVAGIVAILFALFLWYGLEIMVRKPAPKEKGDSMQSKQEPTPLKDKIQFVLTETRVVLPGAQALLGFQFATMLTEAFDKLPASMKYLHLASLFAIAISTMLLMAPAAFHRLADRGDNTERLHTFASAMVLAAMFFLALGIAGDLYIVAQMITKSDTFALVCSIVALLFFYGLWYGYSLLKRGAETESEQAAEQSLVAAKDV